MAPVTAHRALSVALLVLTLGIFVRVRAEAAVAAAAGACSTVGDCFGNGDCVRGVCACDPAWRGSATCDVLAVEPGASDLGYHNASDASWGGNAIQGPDGLWHLFVAQFVNHCPLHYWGSNSEVVHAVSPHPTGPFVYRQRVLAPFAHNPTVRPLPGGGYILYGIGGHPATPVHCNASTPRPRAATSYGPGYRGRPGRARGPANSAGAPLTSPILSSGIFMAVAPTLDGPWTVHTVNFTAASRQPELYTGWTNPSPHFLPNGTVYLAFQAHPKDPADGWELVGVARADGWQGPYSVITPAPVFPEHWWCVAGTAEDPFLWHDPRGWHLIVHGMCPAGPLQAHYAWSPDAVTWHPSPRQTYSYLVNFTEAAPVLFARVERPQLVFGHHNASTGDWTRPLALMNGVCPGLACLFDLESGVAGAGARAALAARASAAPTTSGGVATIPPGQDMTHTLARPLRQS